MNKSIVIVSIVLIISIGLNIFLGFSLYGANKKYQQLEQSINLNAKIVTFASLFIEKVLKANGEISFEDRLMIENAVRDAKDQEIFDQWQKFVGAQTLADGKGHLYDLLLMIVNKLSLKSIV